MTDTLTGSPGPTGDDSDHVTLRGGDLGWRPVSSALATVRLIVLGCVLVAPLVVSVVVAVLVTPWVWLGTLAVLLVAAWGVWIVRRQVSAISWVELDEEIVIRRGRLFRTLVSVPYGRLQYVDIQSGPLMRAFGIASCELHTASPESGGALPGLPTAEAEELRARLARRGEAQRAGL
ncbi:PH domain-containing protein [Phycicoccus sp. CSK15P-2]|uniref:PH domain-containing protein n=1 Tax=Phycicoccus sp. CSK15P-2 TaxID=2807627 RepID=UPI00194F2B7F|nr:PH domain-containing protein [Phycicoccus sp. CSK15P-2]MBM6403643.1 PH domain-containing protein [Phycicoccus sp. CSK15P-2]MBM6405108.1 PH domain-containing protein [Phycicoccus sp. CSK15P-2]